MPRLEREYGEESEDVLDGLVPPSHSSSRSSLEFDDDSSFAPPSLPPSSKRSCRFYIATIQAFLIIYRTEVFLGAALACSLGVALSSFYRRGRVDPFEAARIDHDYSSIRSKYDLTLGSIDHWCLQGDDNECQCEDPLEPMSKRTSHKWEEQHRENIKVATAALMKLTTMPGQDWNADSYMPKYDDMWLESIDDDWMPGVGARFQNDEYPYDPRNPPMAKGGWDDYEDDGYGVPMENPGTTNDNTDGDAIENGGSRVRRKVAAGNGLDVVFVGDSITEQRQGTSMGRDIVSYVAIKEVFEKTFSRDKGGDFDGIAMGIAGDTVRVALILGFCLCKKKIRSLLIVVSTTNLLHHFFEIR